MPTVNSQIRGTADFAGTLGADRNIRSFSDEMFLLQLNFMPLTSLARQIGKKTISAVKHEWLEDELFPETVMVNGQLLAAATTLVVDTPEGDRLEIGDVLMVPSTKEQLLVTAVASATDSTISRGYGATAAATIPDNEVLKIIGSAFEQGSSTPVAKTTLEVLRTNYIQRQRRPFEFTYEAMNQAQYSGHQFPKQKSKSLMEISRLFEYQNFFGEPKEGTNVSGGSPATGGGVRHFIDTYAPTNNKIDASAGQLSEASYLAWIRDVFLNKGDAPLSQKVLYAAPAIITDLEGFTSPDMRITPKTTKHGLKVKEWQTTFGELTIINHPMLRMGANENYGFLLDMANISQVVQKNMDLTYVERDMGKTTGAEKIVGEWKGSQCLEFMGSAGIHGMIENVAD